MTADEHKLVVYMFTRQMVIIRSLIEILESRGIMKLDDYAAFEALIWENEQKDRTNFFAVQSQYAEYAKLLGLDGDLPH
jgi:hypothetical protein